MPKRGSKKACRHCVRKFARNGCGKTSKPEKWFQRGEAVSVSFWSSAFTAKRSLPYATTERARHFRFFTSTAFTAKLIRLAKKPSKLHFSTLSKAEIPHSKNRNSSRKKTIPTRQSS